MAKAETMFAPWCAYGKCASLLHLLEFCLLHYLLSSDSKIVKQ